MTEIDIYTAARQIADIWFQCIQETAEAGGDITPADRRRDGVNPFYSRTETGLAVEFYYGSPSRVATPWGQWHFGGTSSYRDSAQDDAVARFMARVSLRERVPLRRTTMGEFGPVYDVVAIDGQPMPETTMADQKQNGDMYRASKDAWTRLTAEYEEAQRAA